MHVNVKVTCDEIGVCGTLMDEVADAGVYVTDAWASAIYYHATATIFPWRGDEGYVPDIGGSAKWWMHQCCISPTRRITITSYSFLGHPDAQEKCKKLLLFILWVKCNSDAPTPLHCPLCRALEQVSRCRGDTTHGIRWWLEHATTGSTRLSGSFSKPTRSVAQRSPARMVQV